jgi:hypothetical protein
MDSRTTVVVPLGGTLEIASILHDLRNPLSTTHGSAEVGPGGIK